MSYHLESSWSPRRNRSLEPSQHLPSRPSNPRSPARCALPLHCCCLWKSSPGAILCAHFRSRVRTWSGPIHPLQRSDAWSDDAWVLLPDRTANPLGRLRSLWPSLDSILRKAVPTAGMSAGSHHSADDEKDKVTLLVWSLIVSKTKDQSWHRRAECHGYEPLNPLNPAFAEHRAVFQGKSRGSTIHHPLPTTCTIQF